MSSTSAPRFVRRRRGRMIAGVCSGLAPILGMPTGLVRLGFVALATLGGVGILAYAAAWVLVPVAEADPDEPDGPAATPVGSAWGAEAAIVVGAVLLLADLGPGLPLGIVIPALLAAAGGVLVWGRHGTGGRERLRPLRLALGVSLVLAGGISVLAVTGDVRTLGRSAAGAAVVVAGLGLMLGPGLARLVNDLAEERRRRIRSQERAEVATHLHDGVLQTLSLIQKRAVDPREVRTLARRQERELREWLYGPAPSDEPSTVATLLRRELAEVEDDHGVRVESVAVGDAVLDERGRALVAAGREAVLNAARHAGTDVIDVYLEVEPERLALFVRDRGRGFDPATVPADRRGLTDSVRGRIIRHGGAVEIRSAPGEGTEVELWVPRPA